MAETIEDVTARAQILVNAHDAMVLDWHIAQMEARGGNLLGAAAHLAIAAGGMVRYGVDQALFIHDYTACTAYREFPYPENGGTTLHVAQAMVVRASK